ncbi:MAG: type II toxin-antitoxin system HicB family antitoxin [Fimbriimonadaceae bacterium]|nr:type II toxin-antitoxin system HicB family antitoxin [Fimbriimonadaceae bacterium]
MKEGLVFTAIVHTEPDGRLWAEVPSLPGCFTHAPSPEVLRGRLIEAICAYLGIGKNRRDH